MLFLDSCSLIIHLNSCQQYWLASRLWLGATASSVYFFYHRENIWQTKLANVVALTSAMISSFYCAVCAWGGERFDSRFPAQFAITDVFFTSHLLLKFSKWQRKLFSHTLAVQAWGSTVLVVFGGETPALQHKCVVKQLSSISQYGKFLSRGGIIII